MAENEKPFVERRAGYPELLERVARIEKALEEGRKMHETLREELQDIKNLFAGSRYALTIIGWLGAAVLGMLSMWQWLADHFTFGLKQ